MNTQGAWSSQLSDPPDGPSILILKPPISESFKRKSPFRIKRELDALVGDLKQAKCLGGGSLLVEVWGRNQALKLLNTSSLMDIPIRVELSVKLNSTNGKVVSTDLMYMTEEELLEEWEEQGVCGVTRMTSKGGRGNPNPTLKVSFRGESLPKHLMAGYLRIRVSEWVNPPKRCQHCQKYGHQGRYCRSDTPRCGYCAEEHLTIDCAKIEGTSRCAACEGPHPAYSRDCPIWEKECQKEKNKVQRMKANTFRAGDCWPTPQESQTLQNTPQHGSTPTRDASPILVSPDPTHHPISPPLQETPRSTVNQSSKEPSSSSEQLLDEPHSSHQQPKQPCSPTDRSSKGPRSAEPLRLSPELLGSLPTETGSQSPHYLTPAEHSYSTPLTHDASPISNRIRGRRRTRLNQQ